MGNRQRPKGLVQQPRRTPVNVSTINRPRDRQLAGRGRKHGRASFPVDLQPAGGARVKREERSPA
jgi:hypothetical protein